MNATKITSDLAIGSYTALTEMQAEGWKCICLTNEGGEWPCMMVPMNDGGGNSMEMIEQAVQWVLDVWGRGEKAYVCCRHGMNRSVSVSAAALTLAGRAEWLTLALRGIQACRPIATPRDDTLAEVMLVVCKKKGLLVHGISV
jgi:hypothetical protein